MILHCQTSQACSALYNICSTRQTLNGFSVWQARVRERGHTRGQTSTTNPQYKPHVSPYCFYPSGSHPRASWSVSSQFLTVFQSIFPPESQDIPSSTVFSIRTQTKPKGLSRTQFMLVLFCISSCFKISKKNKQMAITKILKFKKATNIKSWKFMQNMSIHQSFIWRRAGFASLCSGTFHPYRWKT